MKNDKKFRVLLVDDHAIMREGLAELINREKDLVVCAEAHDATSALDIFSQPPDIAQWWTSPSTE
jgi:two-component system NarL family response regulator